MAAVAPVEQEDDPIEKVTAEPAAAKKKKKRGHKKKKTPESENSAGAYPTIIEEKCGLPLLVLPPRRAEDGRFSGFDSKMFEENWKSGLFARLASITNRCFICSVWILKSPLVSHKALETAAEYSVRKAAVMACSRLVEGITNISKIPDVRAEIIWRSRDALGAFCDAVPKWERAAFFRVVVLRKLASAPEEPSSETENAVVNDILMGCTRIAEFMFDVARLGFDGRRVAIASGHRMDIAFVLMTHVDIKGAIDSKKFPALSALDFAIPELRQELENSGDPQPPTYYSVVLFSVDALFVGPKIDAERPVNKAKEEANDAK